MTRLLSVLLLSVAATAVSAAPRSLERSGSEIGFSITQMGVRLEGVFRRYEARIDFDPAAPSAGSAELDVDIASLSTGDSDTDQTALTPLWLHQAGHPRAQFRSTSVRALGGDRFEARGLLTIKGRSREIRVPFTVQAQPDGRSLLSGEFPVRRADFGIGGGEWDGLVAAEVPVRFRLRLAPPPSSSPKPATELSR